MNDVAIENIDKIVEMYCDGNTSQEIGKDYGLSEQMSMHMLNAFKKIGVISCEDERERKEKIKEQKVKETEERNRNIIDDYENSISVEDIEKKYAVSYQTIRKILDDGGVCLGRHWYRNSNYPENLIIAILGEIDFEVSEDVKRGLFFSLDTLAEREKKVLEEYYSTEKSFRGIANMFCLSPQRINQIHGKALRKMRSPSRSNYIKFGYDGYTEMVKKKVEKIQKESQDRDRKKKEELQGKLDNKEFWDIKIEELELSTRCYNQLKRGGINTISDIKSKEQLMKVRNFGAKLCDEIIHKTANIGYEIPESE